MFLMETNSLNFFPYMTENKIIWLIEVLWDLHNNKWFITALGTLLWSIFHVWMQILAHLLICFSLFPHQQRDHMISDLFSFICQIFIFQMNCYLQNWLDFSLDLYMSYWISFLYPFTNVNQCQICLDFHVQCLGHQLHNKVFQTLWKLCFGTWVSGPLWFI